MSLASSSARPSLRGQFVDADFDFASLGAALWRARYTILRPTLIVALLTFGVVMLIPPKFQSEARVLIVGRDNVFLRPDADKDILDRGTIDQDTITSQAQLMMSREVANDVITKLELNKLPEFDPAIGGLSPIKSLLAFVGIIKNPMNMTPEERVLDAYYDRLTVFPVEKSHVITIDFLSENPELAARVANAVADAFLQRLAQAKQDQARNAGQWLSGEIETLRKKVADAEGKVEAFRAKSNLLVGPNNTQLSVQQLGDLNAQLATARAQKADAQAKAKLIREMLKSGDPIESSDILNSELIRRLSEQRVTLRAQLAEQSSTLLGNHPRIKELKAQIADLDGQIRKEAETIARSLENDAKLADAKVAAQTANFDQFKSQAVTSNEDDVRLRALEREAKSQRDLLESYLAKYREATARDSIATAPVDARVISRATVSTVPAYPKKLPTIAIASLATMVLMSGIVLTRELMDSPVSGAIARPRRPRPRQKDAEPDTNAEADTDPDLAPIPDRAARFEPAAPPERPQTDMGGTLAARLRSIVQKTPLRNEPLHSEPPRSERLREPAPIGVPVSAIDEFAHNLHAAGVETSQIAFFAAAPQLDTGWVAIKFARALARDARAVLVALGSGDHAIREISNDPAAPGLAELTSGAVSFGDVITRDIASNLNLISSGRGGTRGALLAAPGIARNFSALAQAYPHVVIDAGVLGGRDVERDARAVARIATHAMLLVETLAAPSTTQARDRLLDAGFDNVTIVIAGHAGEMGKIIPPIPAAAA
jgi:succinoglycan biosynthesis transport protein ExoP